MANDFEHGPQHYVPVVYGHDSKTWIRAGSASVAPDGTIRVSHPLIPRTLFLRPVASAEEAQAWPYESSRLEAWGTE